MKKYAIIIFFFFSKFLFPSEIFFIEKKEKYERNKILSLGLNLIAETRNGFLALNDNFGEIKSHNLKKLGNFEKDLYFLTPKIENIDFNSCGKILLKEENLYLIEMDENSICIKNKNFWVQKLSLEKLEPYKEFEKTEIEKNFFVEDMLNNFDEDLAISEFYELVNYVDSRYSTNPDCFSSVERAYNIFQELGLEVEFQDYSSTYAPNVVGTLRGLLEPEKVLILIAHIDDMPKIPPAPGANDNGSGSSMVVNLAKVLTNYRFSYTIKFVLVTGEEQGLVGSTYYAAKAYYQGENIIAVLNADMIGWEGDGKPEEENLDLSYNDNSEELANLFADVYSLYENIVPTLLIYCPENYYSDHYSFWKKGYPAIMGITDNEGICHYGGSYPYYHTRSDKVENCGDLDFFIKTQRAYLSVLAHLAKPLCKILTEKNFNWLDLWYICPVKFK